jgi:hypothetical protein
MKDLDEDTKHVRLSPQVYLLTSCKVYHFLYNYFTRLFLYFFQSYW